MIKKLDCWNRDRRKESDNNRRTRTSQRWTMTAYHRTCTTSNSGKTILGRIKFTHEAIFQHQRYALLVSRGQAGLIFVPLVRKLHSFNLLVILSASSAMKKFESRRDLKSIYRTNTYRVCHVWSAYEIFKTALVYGELPNLMRGNNLFELFLKNFLINFWSFLKHSITSNQIEK